MYVRTYVCMFMFMCCSCMYVVGCMLDIFVRGQVYALGRSTSVVFLFQLGKEGAALDSLESFSAASSSPSAVFLVRGEFWEHLRETKKQCLCRTSQLVIDNIMGRW